MFRHLIEDCPSLAAAAGGMNSREALLLPASRRRGFGWPACSAHSLAASGSTSPALCPNSVLMTRLKLFEASFGVALLGLHAARPDGEEPSNWVWLTAWQLGLHNPVHLLTLMLFSPPRSTRRMNAKGYMTAVSEEIEVAVVTRLLRRQGWCYLGTGPAVSVLEWRVPGVRVLPCLSPESGIKAGTPLQ